MGLAGSKFGQEIEQEEPTQGSLPSTPIVTPKTKLFNLDPRSPSESIIRTPIEAFLEKNKECITDSKKSLSLENKSDTFNIYSPGLKLKSIDPRSPTLEFDRTPIVVPDTETVPKRLHNKNLDNVRKTLMQSPPTELQNKKGRTKATVSPKLLESNLISPKPNENKRKSYVGLLETNLDYVETNLDNVQQNIKINESLNNKYSSLEGSCINTEIDRKLVSEEKLSTPNQNKDSSTLKDITATQKYIHNSQDPRSPTNEFIRTPIEIAKKLSKIKIEEDNSIKIFTDYDDDGLHHTAAAPDPIYAIDNDDSDRNNGNEAKEEYESQIEHLKDFDRKLNNLIYEDKKTECLVRNRKITDCEPKCRTPLGTRNSNINPNKRLSKLRVHDNPQKSREFSRIPIFQTKKGKGKFNKQCENTPPPNFEESKQSDKQKWDPNNTLII